VRQALYRMSGPFEVKRGSKLAGRLPGQLATNSQVFNDHGLDRALPVDEGAFFFAGAWGGSRRYASGLPVQTIDLVKRRFGVPVPYGESIPVER
jgi:hypothetical protein